MRTPVSDPPATSVPQVLARVALGAALVFAGVSHLTFARDSFYAQVPPWLPLDATFVIVFPGNVSQFVTHSAAFGLDSDLSRGIRLFFQPLLVVWALWCTGAWAALRASMA
jgi:uncharacterized membrane protein